MRPCGPWPPWRPLPNSCLASKLGGGWSVTHRKAARQILPRTTVCSNFGAPETSRFRLAACWRPGLGPAKARPWPGLRYCVAAGNERQSFTSQWPAVPSMARGWPAASSLPARGRDLKGFEILAISWVLKSALNLRVAVAAAGPPPGRAFVLDHLAPPGLARPHPTPAGATRHGNDGCRHPSRDQTATRLQRRSGPGAARHARRSAVATRWQSLKSPPSRIAPGITGNSRAWRARSVAAARPLPGVPAPSRPSRIGVTGLQHSRGDGRRWQGSCLYQVRRPVQGQPADSLQHPMVPRGALASPRGGCCLAMAWLRRGVRAAAPRSGMGRGSVIPVPRLRDAFLGDGA